MMIDQDECMEQGVLVMKIAQTRVIELKDSLQLPRHQRPSGSTR